MRCKQCGAEIHREDRLADGRYACPVCGTVHRVKPKAEATNEQKPKRARSRGKAARRRAARRRRALRIAVGVAVAVVLILVLILALRGGAGGLFAPATTPTAAPTPTPATTPTSAPTPTPTPTAVPTPIPTPAPSVHFRAVGDVMSHENQLKHAYRSDGSFDYDPQFMYVKEALSKADYTIANLELSIGAEGHYSGYPTFRIPESILDTLKDCGIDFFTTANNHTLDGFFDGVVKTLDELDERGFAHVGTARTAEEAKAPVAVEINNIKFGFLAYMQVINASSGNIPADKRGFCVNLLQRANFKADVQALRDAGAEVVICMPHWGEEGHKLISAECKRYAKQMVEAGVDIILGSHPHMVQPVEQYELEVNGEKKNVLIAWSLGNFISNMTYRYEDCGIILDFTVTRGEDGKIRIHDVGYVPIYMWNSGKEFHAVCSGDFYQNRPDSMTNASFNRMKQSVSELVEVLGQDNLELLQN